MVAAQATMEPHTSLQATPSPANSTSTAMTYPSKDQTDHSHQKRKDVRMRSRRASTPVFGRVTLLGILACSWKISYRQPQTMVFVLSKPWNLEGQSHGRNRRSSRNSQQTLFSPMIRATGQFRLLRGGDGTDSSGGDDTEGDGLQDTELDDYIEFLLAYAEDRATEDDNPLFREYKGRDYSGDRVPEWSSSIETEADAGPRHDDQNLNDIVLASRTTITTNEMDYDRDREQDLLVSGSNDIAGTSSQHLTETVSTHLDGVGELVVEQDGPPGDLDESLHPIVSDMAAREELDDEVTGMDDQVEVADFENPLVVNVADEEQLDGMIDKLEDDVADEEQLDGMIDTLVDNLAEEEQLDGMIDTLVDDVADEEELDGTIDNLEKDVADEEQLDGMIDTLVATVDNGNEDTNEVASASISMIVDEPFSDANTDKALQAAAQSVSPDENSIPLEVNLAPPNPDVEGEEFFLGSSAVDTLTFSAPAEADSQIPSEDASRDEEMSTLAAEGSLWSTLVRTVRGRQDEMREIVIENAKVDTSPVVDQAENEVTEDKRHDVVVEAASTTTVGDDDSGTVAPPEKSFWTRITGNVPENVKRPNVDPREMQEQALEIFSPVSSEIVEAHQQRHVLLLQRETDETENSEEKADAGMAIERNVLDGDSTKRSSRSEREITRGYVYSAFDQNYKAFKYVTGLLGTRRRPARHDVVTTPSMDGTLDEANMKAHSRIFEKYFASQPSAESESATSMEEPQAGEAIDVQNSTLRGHESSIFKRPWGTLMKYFRPERTMNQDQDVRESDVSSHEYVQEVTAEITSSKEMDVESTVDVTDGEFQENWEDTQIPLDIVDSVLEKSDGKDPGYELVGDEDIGPEESSGGLSFEQASEDHDLVERGESLHIVQESIGHESIYVEELAMQSCESLENQDGTDRAEFFETSDGAESAMRHRETQQPAAESNDVVVHDEVEESPIADTPETDYVEDSIIEEVVGEASNIDTMRTEIDVVTAPDLEVESSEDWESAGNFSSENDVQSECQRGTPEVASLTDSARNLQVSEDSVAVNETALADYGEQRDDVITAGNTATSSIAVDGSDDGVGSRATLQFDTKEDQIIVMEAQENDVNDQSQDDDKNHMDGSQDGIEHSPISSQAFQVENYLPKDDQEAPVHDINDMLAEKENQVASAGNLNGESSLDENDSDLEEEKSNPIIELEDTLDEDDVGYDEGDDERRIFENVDDFEVFEGTLDDVEEDDYNGEDVNNQQDGRLASIHSRSMSYQKDPESQNFLLEFLLARGMDQWVMTAVVLFEWFRVYILAPIVESLGEIMKAGKQSGLYRGRKSPKWMNTRGGASSSSGDDGESRGPLKEDNIHPEEDSEEINGNVAGGKSQGGNVLAVDGVNGATDVTTHSDGNLSTRKVRPNRVYRYLLSYGVVGHILIMESVLAIEWMHVYIPFVPALVQYLMHDILKFQNESSRGSGEPLVSRTSGFLNVDGSVVRGGRKRKAQTRKDDQQALNQLKKLGNVNEAKYHFLSQSFMARHGLGTYARKRSENDARRFEVEANELVLHTASSSGAEDIESDAEWIVEALTHDMKEADSPLDTKIGASFGKEGPKLSIGIGFSIGEPRQRSTRSSSDSASISDVLRRRTDTASKKRKSSGPRVSDRDSGVMGRLRAAGANSIMGRNILGAYPGDLPPPYEAADVRGLTELASRYGYGDWSDDDDVSDDHDYVNKEFGEHDADDTFDLESMDEDGIVAPKRRRRMKSSTSKTQRRKRKSTFSPTIASDLNLSTLQSGSSTSTSKMTGTKAASLTKKPRAGLAMEKIQSLRTTKRDPGAAMKATNKPSSEPSDVLDELTIMKKSNVRPAMSRLNQSRTVNKTTATEMQTGDQKKKSAKLQPATSLLNKANVSSKTTATQMLKDYQEKKKKVHPVMTVLKERKEDGNFIGNSNKGD